jgi:cytosine/adenosine deaminase-related metal-dependent hydrolase
MRQSAELARKHRIQLHTHVAETIDEERFCLEKFGCRPLSYLEELGWVGEDVWYAHAVHLTEEEIRLLARTGTGVAHCPSSNMRLGSGIAPIREMLDEGVKVGLAVDGSASNDSSHMLAEVRQAMLLQRAVKGPDAMSAEEALEIATLGGAKVLGRDDIGSLEVGKAADFIAIDINRLGYAGALHDPLAALVFCAPQNVDISVINGRLVVDRGRIVGFDLDDIIARHNEISRRMLERAGVL